MAVLLLYEVKAIKTQRFNLCIIKILSFYCVVLKTVLVLPLALAYFCCLFPSLNNIPPNQESIFVPFSVLGLISLLTNYVLVLLLFRDNSPFSTLPFASSLNWLDQ